ncbi:hypothetical protein SUGI_1050970 [Cryptomeria japonica]|uniref:uncharacterized protein LOC131039454 n=1 Tax=Cryptomeria japonica TaxID=3369 RepID=UPI002414A97E|nr:uncharacterized protein LOC131039454 [Cryptomeria japonica]GLJ49553.1 hypothetical protein SUGI_1050970 [Cryptomeria japonica]
MPVSVAPSPFTPAKSEKNHPPVVRFLSDHLIEVLLFVSIFLLVIGTLWVYFLKSKPRKTKEYLDAIQRVDDPGECKEDSSASPAMSDLSELLDGLSRRSLECLSEILFAAALPHSHQSDPDFHHGFGFAQQVKDYTASMSNSMEDSVSIEITQTSESTDSFTSG